MKRTQLSILIPTYNDPCLSLVKELLAQAEAERPLYFEIVVGNDGSTAEETEAEMRDIALLPLCQVVSMTENVGRACIRNVLARAARYDWLLFIDADMEVASTAYLSNYLQAEGEVVYGGYSIPERENALKGYLRYKYECGGTKNSHAELRRRNPYQDFHTSNFLVRRTLYLEHPLDERFRHYGYEDVLFGKQLRRAGISIRHIDNPLLFAHFEDNRQFLQKTETAMRTLSEFKDELRGYSRLISFAERLCRLHLAGAFRLAYKLTRGLCLKNLLSTHPSLRVFTFYKLGYYLDCQKGTHQLV